MNLSIVRPGVLLLIPVIVLLLLWSGRYLRAKSRAKKWQFLGWRMAVGILLILALAQVHITFGKGAITTIYLLDVSDSMKNQITEEEDFIRESMKKLPKEELAGVIAFGRNANVEQFVSQNHQFDSVQTTPIQTATNLEEAIQSALAMFPSDSAKRLVLLTDGAENAGNIRGRKELIAGNELDLKVVLFEPEVGREVYVDDLKLPEKIRLKDEFPIEVSVQSNLETGAKLFLYAGRNLIGEKNVQLVSGENHFVFTQVQEESGQKSYRVVVEAEQDSNTINNEYSAYTDVMSPPKVLVVEGVSGNAKAFVKLLKAAGFPYEVVSPSGVPRTLDQMNEYASIVLNNVFYDDLKEDFVKLLPSYVKDYAGGLIAIGGDNSYALGGYRNTELEKILPVRMDLTGEKEIPKMAMAMVMDHSGSMTNSFGNITCLDLAKQAAVKGLDSLRKSDEIGVLAFDDRYEWAVPLQIAVDLPAIEEDIAQIEPGGGTSIYPALLEAVEELQKSDAKLKHIILLTDGQDGFRDYRDILAMLHDSNITLSTVAVGSDADQAMLEALAAGGSGRYYYTDINKSIPKIFAKEYFLAVKSYLVQQTFTPVVVSNHSILKGVDGELPKLRGYIASTIKDTAKLILQSDEQDPILSIWQYGLGKTIAWNSDVNGQWSQAYIGWEQNLVLWNNILEASITELSSDEDQIAVTQEQTMAKIMYTAKEYNADTSIEAVITSQDGTQKKVVLNPKAPGEYETELELNQTGVYSISLQKKEGKQVISHTNTAAVMQYSPEYRFAGNVKGFQTFVKEAGGTLIQKPSEVTKGDLQAKRSDQDLTNPLILLALLLFFLDVVLRRLNVDLSVVISCGMTQIGHICCKRSQVYHTRKKINGKTTEGVAAEEKIEPDISAELNTKTKIKTKSRTSIKRDIKADRLHKDTKKKQETMLDTSSLLKKKKDRSEPY